jgi:hypothetical protein
VREGKTNYVSTSAFLAAFGHRGQEIPEFFKTYDVRSFAHVLPLRLADWVCRRSSSRRSAASRASPSRRPSPSPKPLLRALARPPARSPRLPRTKRTRRWRPARVRSKPSICVCLDQQKFLLRHVIYLYQPPCTNSYVITPQAFAAEWRFDLNGPWPRRKRSPTFARRRPRDAGRGSFYPANPTQMVWIHSRDRGFAPRKARGTETSHLGPASDEVMRLP